jgi:hypothetical protein
MSADRPPPRDDFARQPPPQSALGKAMSWGFGLTFGYILALGIIPCVLLLGCAGCCGVIAVVSSLGGSGSSRPQVQPQAKPSDVPLKATESFGDGFFQAWSDALKRGEEAERTRQEAEGKRRLESNPPPPAPVVARPKDLDPPAEVSRPSIKGPAPALQGSKSASRAISQWQREQDAQAPQQTAPEKKAPPQPAPEPPPKKRAIPVYYP